MTMTIWQQRLIEVREKAQEMKQEAHRLRERDGTYHPFRAGEVGEILFAWADELEAIVSPRRAYTPGGGGGRAGCAATGG